MCSTEARNLALVIGAGIAGGITAIGFHIALIKASDWLDPPRKQVNKNHGEDYEDNLYVVDLQPISGLVWDGDAYVWAQEEQS